MCRVRRWSVIPRSRRCWDAVRSRMADIVFHLATKYPPRAIHDKAGRRARAVCDKDAARSGADTTAEERKSRRRGGWARLKRVAAAARHADDASARGATNASRCALEIAET